MPFSRRVPAGRFGTFLYDPEEDRYEFDAAARLLLGPLAGPDTGYRDVLARIPSDVRRDYELWRHEAATGGAGRIRVPFSLEDRRAVLEVQLQPEGDHLKGMLCDVSLDEAAHRYLSSQLEVMELAARLARFGVWVYDVQKDAFAASREAVEMLLPGADPPELSLEDVLELVHGDDRDRIRQAHHRAIETGQVQRVEFRRRDRWFVLHFVRVLDEAGEPAKTCGMIHETTNLHTQAAMAEELRGLDRFRSRFVQTAAHELSQPLTPMRLQIEAMREHLPKDHEVRRGLAVVESNLERVSLMIDDLLDAARSHAGHLNVDLRPADPVPAITHIVQTLQPLAATRGVHIEWTPTQVPQVLVDSHRLQQCISNVLHNAIKFTRRGGRVWVGIRHAGDVVVSVQDEGPGLDPKQAGALFEPFRQVHLGPPGMPGTGLGLYITRSILGAMGGRIEVESAEGGGATFHLHLVVAQASA